MGTPFRSTEWIRTSCVDSLQASTFSHHNSSCHANMKLWSTLLLSLSAISSVLAAKPAQDTFSKYQSLSRSGPVDLDNAAYEELTNAPRDYYAAVILTAMDVRYGCAMCREFDPEWSLIARSWNKGTKPDGLKLVFGTLDFDKGKTVFQKVSVQTGKSSMMQQWQSIANWIIILPNSSCSKPLPLSSSSLPPLDLTLSWTPSLRDSTSQGKSESTVNSRASIDSSHLENPVQPLPTSSTNGSLATCLTAPSLSWFGRSIICALSLGLPSSWVPLLSSRFSHLTCCPSFKTATSGRLSA